MERTKEPGLYHGSSLPKEKLNLNWIKSLDLTQTSLQKNRGMKESVKHHHKNAVSKTPKVGHSVQDKQLSLFNR